MNRPNSFLNFMAILIVFLFATTKSFGQPSQNYLDIKTILENSETFNDTFVKFKGTVSNFQSMSVHKGYSFLSKFTVTDQTDSIKVIAFETTLKDKDSISVIGKFQRKRMVGQYIVGENEVDASIGQINIIKGWYLDMMNQPLTEENNFVPVNQVETASTNLVTYATILGVLFTAITLIPLLFRKRRFNIDLKITSPSPPVIVKPTSSTEKYIAIELLLYNLQLLHPEINSYIVCKIGDATLSPAKVTGIDSQEIKFPLRVENKTTLTLYFNYDNCIQHFSNSEIFIVKLKDEFCSKIFKGKFNFNFLMPSDNKDENN
ncbi:MAG: hypothetical protein JNK14_19260 [Chitinophagaceae bacterium]|nr:hypothetical protein [Chitinophagaceae bacterium]